MRKAIEFYLDDQENKFVDCALKIDQKFLMEQLKTCLLEISQKIICNFTIARLKEDKKNDLVKTDYKRTLPSKIENIPFEEKEKNITYKYADKEWKRKALETVIEKSKENLKSTPDEIFDAIGVSPAQKKHFRRNLGVFMKKSGVSSKKIFSNGTTRLYYFI